MDIPLRQVLVDAIKKSQPTTPVVSSISLQPDGSGSISYNVDTIWIDPTAPGFSAGTIALTDEELVRAYLLTRLTTVYGYTANKQTIEVERVYKPVGRPQGKGGRIDVLVRKPSKSENADAFLFIECKAPSKFDADLKYIDGQLFRLSRQELTLPRYLVYYTVELKGNALQERVILIDTQSFPDFATWDKAGQPITDVIPAKYGVAAKKRYANVKTETTSYRPLDTEVTPETLNRLRTELHDVIWGGGGTNNNEVFVIIVRLILCKIYDEKETRPNEDYKFQRGGDALSPENPLALVERLNSLYRIAESSYLALPTSSAGPAFDPGRIAPEKIAYVVGRLEGLSVTENKHPGDLLGEFFEQIVSQDFTQSRGQFFTHVKIVRFMLHLVGAVEHARNIMLHDRDHLGRPRLPYIIDPSCGSGTFLIEYMKLIRSALSKSEVTHRLPPRVSESHFVWFSGASGNIWAREYLYGIENNYDLGLSAKVNMVLHGDGSMNTWIKSGLLPFAEYWTEGRTNILGSSLSNDRHPYGAARNEQFDLILSNPPFSLTLSPDEKTKIAEAFEVVSSAQSEAIFIERWYQLLRERGIFCCILPEAILDSSSFLFMRLFLIQYFKLEAIISLPYDAFRPFTSTKTCILYARKRTSKEVQNFRSKLKDCGLTDEGGTPEPDILSRALEAIGWAAEPIFFAEPTSIGYKRRKNLPDLLLPNLLYQEDSDGGVRQIEPNYPRTVLDYYFAGIEAQPSATLGFRSSLRNISLRKGFRLDSKYRWLWDFQNGVAFGDPNTAVELSTFLSIVDLPKIPKGDLPQETTLIDLEHVESRQALLNNELPQVDIIGSDRVKFVNCDLLISKLEPYLGKIIIQPNPEHIGSTEWIGLRITQSIPHNVVAYLLMLPELCEAYRRLQSGKRHARFDPKEFLSLRVQLPDETLFESLNQSVSDKRGEIIRGRERELDIRRTIDTLFGNNARRTR
jgi:type I restriction enzyme M protein